MTSMKTHDLVAIIKMAAHYPNEGVPSETVVRNFEQRLLKWLEAQEDLEPLVYVKVKGKERK